LTDEGIDEPLQALVAARIEHGVSPDAFRVLDFGETLTLPPPPPLGSGLQNRPSLGSGL
jgi:hypothetical protein